MRTREVLTQRFILRVGYAHRAPAFCEVRDAATLEEAIAAVRTIDGEARDAEITLIKTLPPSQEPSIRWLESWGDIPSE